MEINELNKKQLVLLTLLITFVVSIATGIVTVSLMQQMPKSVPQTINNVIQRTIEKVTTVEVPIPSENTNTDNQSGVMVFDSDTIVTIYAIENSLTNEPVDVPVEESIAVEDPLETEIETKEPENKDDKVIILGEGIIISDVGLILVESSILNGYERYKIVLDKNDFEVSILKKFGNDFTVLKIMSKQEIKNKENNLQATVNL